MPFEDVTAVAPKFEDVTVKVGEVAKPFEDATQVEPSFVDAVKSSDFGIAKTENFLRQTAHEAAFIGDMVASLPAMAASAGVFTATEALGLMEGYPHKQVSEFAQKNADEVSSYISNPLQKALRGLGLAQKTGDAPAVTESLMQKASALIDRTGQWAEEHSGGRVTKEEVGQLANEIMLGGAVHGAGMVDTFSMRKVDTVKPLPETAGIPPSETFPIEAGAPIPEAVKPSPKPPALPEPIAEHIAASTEKVTPEVPTEKGPYVPFFETKRVEPPGPLDTPEGLATELHKNIGQTQADAMGAVKYREAAAKDGVTPEMSTDFRDYSEAVAAGEKPKVSDEFKEKYDKWAGTLQTHIVAAMKRMSPEIANEVVDNFSNRIALKRSLLWEGLKDDAQQAGEVRVPGRFAAVPTVEKGRTVFALGDSIITVKPSEGGKWSVTKWENGEYTPLGEAPARPKVGDSFMGEQISSAKQADIETHTHVRYLSDDLAVKGLLLQSLLKTERERAFIDKLKENPAAKNYMVPEKDAATAPPGFRMLSGDAQTALPALRGNLFHPEYAEVLEDFALRYKNTGLLDFANNIIIRSMMINPLPHFMNEFVHWFDARGASGFVSPVQISGASKGLPGLGLVKDAVKSVLSQDAFQRELSRKGGFLLAPTTKAQIAFGKAMQVGLQDIWADAMLKKNITAIASATGTTAARILKSASDLSSNIMWSTRDMMYTHLIKEQMAMGKTMEGAIAEVGKHMPEYFIPHRVLGSRGTSQLMQSKLFVFGRYHYGMLRAMGENAEELGKLGRDNAEFKKGIDHTLGMALGAYGVYRVLDAAYSSAFGQPAEARRAGVYHLISNVNDVYGGKKNVSAALSSVLTLNPAIGVLGDVRTGRDWRGKEIIPTGTPLPEAGFLAARYGLGQLAPIQGLQRGVEGKDTMADFIARQLDVKLQSVDKEYKQTMWRLQQRQRAEQATKKLESKYGVGK